MTQMNEIQIYQTKGLSARIEVRVEDDTIWLTQQLMSVLFDVDVRTISEHIGNIYKQQELKEEATIRKFRTVQKEGNRNVSRKLTYYNLDMIISIGYRVNSIRGTQFRIWANKVLRDHLIKGYSLNQRMNRLENNMENLEEKVNKIDLQIKSELLPTQGIFFEGQIFDAYKFVSDLFRSAEFSIAIIDNYLNDSVLTHLSKKKIEVEVTIFTRNINKQLKLDVQKFNEQYKNLTLKKFDKSHDRFIIIDDKDIYHFGASLKDLGKKWFAFSKFDKDALTILEKLEL